MVTNKPITKEYFIKRLTDLCIKSGLADFPKDETNLHILLKSAILMVDQPDPYPELFEETINQLDITREIEAAREEIAHRKQEYLQKSKGA